MQRGTNAEAARDEFARTYTATASTCPPTPKGAAAVRGVSPVAHPAGEERVRIVYLTTLRELCDDEKVGSRVVDPENGTTYGRRQGNLEDLLQRLSAPGSAFGRTFELAGVVFDDDPKLVAEYKARGVPWDWSQPVPIRRPNGTTATVTLDSLCHNHPSLAWRAEKDPLTKSAMKAAYEREIVATLNHSRADLVISDSYTRIAGPTLLAWFGTLERETAHGRGINIHPAIARVDDPTRLPGVTPTRDAYTRARYGYIIIDDKKAVDLPEGERIHVDYEGQQRLAVRVPEVHETGVTVHVLAPRVDNGRVILEKKAPLPIDGITAEGVRELNYELKREALAEALTSYVKLRDVKKLIDAHRATRRA